MQFIGFAIVIVGCVEIVVGAVVMSTVTSIFGAWWAGLGCAVCGFLALIQNNSQLRQCALCFAVLAAICAIVGLAMDGVGYTFMMTFDTCISSSSGEAFGDTSTAAVTFVLMCGGLNDYDCVCGDTSKDVGEDNSCIGLNLNHDPGNCGQVLGIYRDTLLKSVRCLDCLVALTLLALAHRTFARCCPGTCAHNNAW